MLFPRRDTRKLYRLAEIRRSALCDLGSFDMLQKFGVVCVVEESSENWTPVLGSSSFLFI
jgi:hypothetical protein